MTSKAHLDRYMDRKIVERYGSNMSTRPLSWLARSSWAEGAFYDVGLYNYVLLCMMCGWIEKSKKHVELVIFQ